MNIRKWLKKRFQEFKVFDPNSAEGLRLRANRLVEKGIAEDSPSVTCLLKRADLLEGKPIPRNLDGSALSPSQYMEYLHSKGWKWEFEKS